MKSLFFPILAVLMLAAGCMPVAPPPANELPTAYIDSVSAARISPGETVTFTGHGIDSDGSVAAYSWRSSIDGEASTSATFKTSSLSEGSHTIWFRVQDDRGDWSKEVPCHVTVLPSGIVLPVIDLFEASPPSIAGGESSTLDWSVSDASLLRIDPGIGNVSLTGNRVVSPTATTVYTLMATNEAGSVTATTQIAVTTVPAHTVEVFSIAAEGGHVRRDEYVGPDPNVGDMTPVRSDVATQAFLSFDISMVPTGATIESAFLDLTKASIYGAPFTYLGRLFVYNDQYGDLDSRDFNVGPVVPGALYTTFAKPTEPFTSSQLTEAVQTQVDVGSARFQVRLQFEKYTYFNEEADYLALGAGKAKLVIQYRD
jgi:hypothetical protein